MQAVMCLVMCMPSVACGRSQQQLVESMGRRRSSRTEEADQPHLCPVQTRNPWSGAGREGLAAVGCEQQLRER